MTQLWSPNTILKLSSDGRCVGQISSKERKCRTCVSHVNLTAFNSLVAEIAAQDPNVDHLRPKLHRMARHGLCRANHQYQIDDMVNKWTSRIRIAFPPEIERQSHRDAARSAANSRASSVQSRSMASVSSSTPEHSEIQTLQETIAAMQETIRIAQRQLDRLQYASPSVSSLSRVETDEISSLWLSRSSTMQSVITTSSESTEHVASTPLAHSGLTQQLAAIRLEETTPTPETTPCTHTHVRRLDLDDECAICYDEEHLSECASEDLVWCKAGCGKSVHRTCFVAWQESCLDAGREATCTHCRTPWVYECAC